MTNIERKLDEIQERVDNPNELINMLLDFNESQKLSKDIITKLEQIEAEIHEIENKDDIIAQLNENHKSLIKKATVAAKKISKARLNGAHLLQASVNAELKDLNMKGFEFLVSIHPKEMNHNGIDEVEFMCKAGKNMQPRPLAKTASGGELSRILLSLKNVIGASDLARTYLFDEVDTGVSGETAQKVGKKLRQIAQGQQVICITHLPQVACYADHHFCIEKQSSKSSVSMQIRYLNKKDQIQEIARLISGEKISKTSLAHAKELLGNI